MAIFQVEAVTGNEIIWVSGSGLNTAGSFTAAEIDNEIAYNGDGSIMEVHRTLFNKWLMSCQIQDGVGGAAETLQQQALINRSFKMLCFYAYSKDSFLMDLQTGKCDCECEPKRKQFLSTFSEEVICRSFGIKCLKDNYLEWLHGSCDKRLSAFFSTEIVTKDCTPPLRERARLWNFSNEPDCDCCGS